MFCLMQIFSELRSGAALMYISSINCLVEFSCNFLFLLFMWGPMGRKGRGIPNHCRSTFASTEFI